MSKVLDLAQHRAARNPAKAGDLTRDLAPMVEHVVNVIMRHKLTEAQAIQVFGTLAQNAHRGIRPLLNPK